MAGDLPEADRAYRVAERAITRESGEPVETVLKAIWPTTRLPELIEQWTNEFEPDVVLFVVSPYWMTFASTPLLLRRRFGRIGKAVGDAGTRMGESVRISATLPMRVARKVTVSTIGGAYLYEPAFIAELVEQCGRRVLAHEDTEVLVRGPLNALGFHGSRRSMAQAEARRQQTESLLIDACQRLRIAYVGRPETFKGRGVFEKDLVHTGTEGHRQRGELEGIAIARAWLEARKR